MTLTVNLNVTPLNDNDVAFATAQAWNNYWYDVQATAILNPISVATYTQVPYDNTLQPIELNYGNIVYDIPSTDMFTNLLNAYTALNTSYQALRTALINAGLITQV